MRSTADSTLVAAEYEAGGEVVGGHSTGAFCSFDTLRWRVYAILPFPLAGIAVLGESQNAHL